MGYRVTATDQLIEEYIRNPINKKDCFWTSHNLIRESKNIIPTHIFKIKADFVTDILIPSLVNNGQKFIYFLKTEKDANSIVNMCCEKTNDKKGSIFINGNIEQSNILYFDAKTRKKTEDLRKSILKKLKDEYLQKSEYKRVIFLCSPRRERYFVFSILKCKKSPIPTLEIKSNSILKTQLM